MSTVAQVLNAPPAVWGLSKGARMMRYSRPDEAAAANVAMNRSLATVQGGSFGKKNEWHAYACSQCGFCRRDAPMTYAVGFEAGTPSALLTMSKLYVEGKLPITKKVEDLVAGFSESFIKDEVCPSRIPISQLAKDLRTQLELDTGRKLSVPNGLKDRIKQAETKIAEREKRYATIVEAPKPAAPAEKPHAKPVAPAATAPKVAPPSPPGAMPGAGPKPAPA